MIKIGNKEELSKQIGKDLVELVKVNPMAKLILATGMSPVEVYKSIIETSKTEGVSFQNVSSYNLDEYLEINPETDRNSFKTFMNENLFDHIDINKAHTYFPNTPESYDRKLDLAGDIDWAIIGVGTNGHIAFNEPPADSEKRTNIVVLSKSTIKSNFPGRENHPRTAITMGMKDIIERPNKIVLVAWGEGKRAALEAYKNALETGEVDPNWPITYLIKVKNLEIYTDLDWKYKKRNGEI